MLGLDSVWGQFCLLWGFEQLVHSRTFNCSSIDNVSVAEGVAMWPLNSASVYVRVRVRV